jgi:hypothetical protein
MKIRFLLMSRSRGHSESEKESRRRSCNKVLARIIASSYIKREAARWGFDERASERSNRERNMEILHRVSRRKCLLCHGGCGKSEDSEWWEEAVSIKFSAHYVSSEALFPPAPPVSLPARVSSPSISCFSDASR